MQIDVVEKIKIPHQECEKVGEFLYHRPSDTMYVDCAWWFPVQMCLSEGLSKCQATPMFMMMPFLLKKWINLDILLREVKLLKLALTDKILMHGSCVDNNLIVGFPNSGKTYQTYLSVANGGKLISEEYTVISRMDDKYKRWKAEPFEKIMRTCFSARTMKDCGIKTSFREKLWLAVATLRAKLFPFMYESVIWKRIPVSGDSAEIKTIQYGSTGREIKNWKQFAILCENEFPFMSSEFLQAYALASGLDLLKIQETQRKLIKDFVNDTYPSNRK
jgi:hypothetical protein